MEFRTKLDYSDNRQIKQRERSETTLSGTTIFGMPFSGLTSGPDLATTAQTSQYFGVTSTYSGNSATTIFTWGISNVSIIDPYISALTPSNSGVSQNIIAVFAPSSSTVIDGNTVNLTYSGVAASNLYAVTMTEPTPGNYTGTVSTDFFVFSAQGLDFTGRTIWVDNTEILRTKKLIVSDNPQPGYVLTSDYEGMATWQSVSAITSGSTIWTAGTGVNSAVLGGSDSDGSGDYSVVYGFRNKATGDYTHAEGYMTSATTVHAHAEGRYTLSSNQSTHAEGEGTTASGMFSHSEGSNTIASGDSSHAEGSFTIAGGSSSHSEGNLTTAIGTYSHAEGYQSIASGQSSHAEGQQTTASNDYSHAEGIASKAKGSGSHAEGGLTTSIGTYSHAEGESTIASGDNSHAEGAYTTAIANVSHAEGSYTTAIGLFGSHAEGTGTIASGWSSHAEGQNTTAKANYSHSEGYGTKAIGSYSHAEGNITTSIGDFGSHSEGYNTIASGQSSHAEGQYTKASGVYSHTEGSYSTASGDTSHAEGANTTAKGDFSHSQNRVTIASGYASHAGGNNTTASGLYSFIHSNNSTVSGDRSAVIGGQNITATANDTVYVPDLVIDGLTSQDPIATDANGKIVAGTSDIRLKQNVNTLTNALDVIKNLRGVSFEYTEESNMGSGIRFGFIAQEVQEIVPDMVRLRAKGDGMLNLNYTEVIPWLVEAIKDLSKTNISSSELVLETQTIAAEDNNIELNYNGNTNTAIGGGITIIKGINETTDAEFKINSNGDWVTNNLIIPNGIVIPMYTPKSSSDIYGKNGEITRDENYLYIKTQEGWKRSPLEIF